MAQITISIFSQSSEFRRLDLQINRSNRKPVTQKAHAAIQANCSPIYEPPISKANQPKPPTAQIYGKHLYSTGVRIIIQSSSSYHHHHHEQVQENISKFINYTFIKIGKVQESAIKKRAIAYAAHIQQHRYSPPAPQKIDQTKREEQRKLHLEKFDYEEVNAVPNSIKHSLLPGKAASNFQPVYSHTNDHIR